MMVQSSLAAQFQFLEPKRFYRKLEEIFKMLPPSPSARFATDFLSAFYDHLADGLGIAAIQLHERFEGKITLIKRWGSLFSDAAEVLNSLIRSEELPWFGEFENRITAVVRSGYEESLFMVFVSDAEFNADPIYMSGFTAAFTSLEYALQQNAKRLELQDAFEQARAIQASLLPAESPVFGDYDIAAMSMPAMIVAGDVYDFQFRKPETLAITIADAAGHGLAAALQARDVVTATRTGVAGGLEIVKLMETINGIIRQSGLGSRFVSMIYAELGLTGKLSYVNAGHPRPLLFSQGRFIELDDAGMILGSGAQCLYRLTTVEITHGAALILFTDGLIEHESIGGTEFGLEGLKEWMNDWQEAPASMALHALFRRLQDFGHQKLFRDDVTAIYLKRL